MSNLAFIITWLVFFSILVLIDIYVFTGIKAALSGFSARVNLVAKWCYWSLNGLFFFMIAYTLFSPNGTAFPNPFPKTLILYFVLLYIPKTIFLLFLVGEDIYRIFRAMIIGMIKLTTTKTKVVYFESRRRFISQIAGLVTVIPIIGIIYGVTKGKYNFKVHKTEIFFEDLPEQFNGLTITQISDIHAGSFDDPEEVKHAVRLANEQNSDIMFFTGDLVNFLSAEMEPWVTTFKQLHAPMGKYSILGNHDYGDYMQWNSEKEKEVNHKDLLKMHERIGFKLLRNENTKIEKDGAGIDLLGVENWGSGAFTKHGDLRKTLEGTMPGSFKILLSHDPSHWENQVMNHAEHIHLTLSGHTHGMQFCIEIPGFKFSPIQFRYKRWAGLYKENNRYIYVNRGLGFLAFPGRVGIWPEITVLTLRRPV